jgi:hypothetical protein
MLRAMMLFGNGEGRTTKELEDDMSAPDFELLQISYHRLIELKQRFQANAIAKGLGAK